MQSLDQLHPLLLNIGLAVHNADWNWKNVNSPFARIYYVTEGIAQLLLPQGVQTLRPHHLYLVPAFTLHSYQCDSRFVHYYLHVYEDHQTESSFFEYWDFPTEIPVQGFELSLIQRLLYMNPTMQLSQSDPTTYDNDSTLLENILKNKRRAFSDKVESRGILYQLLACFLKGAKPKETVGDNRIQQVLIYIRRNLFTSIEMKTLVGLSCLSEDHFIRLFKKETGTTPLQYINMKRMEKAQLILVTENLSVKDIAYRLAYEDPSYFIRLFKKLVGVTPTQYRTQNKASEK